MKRGVGILALLVIVTIIGGLLTANLGFSVPTIIQSQDPAASAFNATPNQALYLALWIGFVLVNVVGAGLTIALVLWLADRGKKWAEVTPVLAEREPQVDQLEESKNDALPETSAA